MTRSYNCVYCRRGYPRTQLTRDHVIAGSWYPQSTPRTVQRITALSCRSCNTERYSAAESYLLLRLSACVDPLNFAASGVWEQAKQAIDADLATTDRERTHRQVAWEAFNRDIAEIATPPAEGLLPSFSANFEIGSRTLVRIQADKLNYVIEKWALGIHSYVWKEPASEDAEISVMHLSEEDVRNIFQEAGPHWRSIDKGPGVQVRYLADRQGSERSSLYEFKIWGQFIAYASIRESLGLASAALVPLNSS
jgi:hypothetical protein